LFVFTDQFNQLLSGLLLLGGPDRAVGSPLSSSRHHQSSDDYLEDNTHTTVLLPFFWDHPGEPVPKENFWTLWCNRGLTEADTQTIRLVATPSRVTSTSRTVLFCAVLCTTVVHSDAHKYVVFLQYYVKKLDGTNVFEMTYSVSSGM